MTIRVTYRQKTGEGVRRWTDTVEADDLDMEQLEHEAAANSATIWQVCISDPEGLTILSTTRARARRFAQPTGWATADAAA
jgi:hypothetical protein